jgi:glycerol kinase
MSTARILAIDQGTTTSRALVVDERGTVLGIGQEAFRQHFPLPDRVEHDPLDIWSSTTEAIATALAGAGIAARELSCIGVTNQRETLVVWDRATGEPLTNAIVWQDRRTATMCAGLQRDGHEPAIAHATGLTIDPYFTSTKLAWLLREHPEWQERGANGEIAAGTVDAWLMWKLTGGALHASDFTNASRTMLFNIRRGRWDAELCRLFDVPQEMLPRAQPSIGTFGVTADEALGARVPITGVAGDQQAALFGQACAAPGQAKNTYGTGAFLLAPAGQEPRESKQRLLVSLGANTGQSGPEYVIEGSVFVAGAAIQWLRDQVGAIETAAESEDLAASVSDTGGVVFVPAFTGLGAPYWDAEARGAVLGLTRGSGRAQIARAALEAIALSCADLVAAMNEDLPQPISELRVDGGAARNNLLMQMQADLAGITVVRPINTETTALGAAYLAGIGAGVWANSEEVGALWQPERTFEPAMEPAQRDEKLETWHRALSRVRGFAAGR